MENNPEQKPRRGLLVEDETVIAGTDHQTGATVVRPKTHDGRADESTDPTDRRER